MLKIEYDYHAAKIQTRVREGPQSSFGARVTLLLQKNSASDASFRVLCRLLSRGRAIILFVRKREDTQKVGQSGLRSMRYRGGGRGRQKTRRRGALPKDNDGAGGRRGGSGGEAKTRASTHREKQMNIIFATQLYYTQAWSNIDYDILEMTNIKAAMEGGGHAFKKVATRQSTNRRL